MRTTFEPLSAAPAALYTWLVTIFFGFVVLDMQYARGAPPAAAAFESIADFLLLAGFFTVLAGLGAVVLSRRSRTALLLYIASLLALLPEFLLPVLAALLPGDAQGPAWLRPLPVGAASILAFAGLVRLCASPGSPARPS